MFDSSCAERRAGFDIGSGEVVYENVHKEFACAVDHPHHAHAGLRDGAVNKHFANASTGHRRDGEAMTQTVPKLYLHFAHPVHTNNWPAPWQSHNLLEPLKMARELRRLKHEYHYCPSIGCIDFGDERRTDDVHHPEHAQGHKPP